MDTKGIDQLLSQLKAASSLAAGNVEAPAPGAPGNFAALLEASLNQVNATQQDARGLARAFEQGAPNVNIEDVIIQLQKADVSFQTMVQVRNKLVEAYQQIMNLPV